MSSDQSTKPLSGLRLAVVLKGYPRLSETFIAQEIEGLEKAGAELNLISLRHPTDPYRHPVHERIKAPVNYLPEYLYQEPGRVLRAWLKVRRLPGYRRAYQVWRQDLARDRTSNRVRRFGQAMVMAAELGTDQDLIYAHFIHTPCSVARYAAIMTGQEFAISAHAKDIYTSPDWELSEKLDDAKWTVTCTAGNVSHLRERSEQPEKVHLVYHGLDLAEMPKSDAAEGAGPLRLMTVGRAVKKKGLDTILEALAQLPADIDWHWDHVGGGDELADLKSLGTKLGLDDRITWHGPKPRAEIVKLYQVADLFLLASRITGSGDRDGLPNVLMEAASQGVPALGTNVGAIPEFITDGETGRLVEPNDPAAFAQVITELARDPAAREEMGAKVLRHLETAFTFDHCLSPLLELMQEYATVKSTDPNTAPDPFATEAEPKPAL